MPNQPDLQALTLSGIAHRCGEETDRFFRRLEYDPDYCYELFRRAILDGNQGAHTCLYEQYQPLVAGWVERHPSYGDSGEEVQYFVNRAFEKLWHALTPDKFERFSTLKAILSYLKMCTHSAIIDHSRTRRHLIVDEEPTELLQTAASEASDVEADAIYRSQRQSFWRLIDSRLNDEREQVVLYGCFVLALKPRELQVQYSHLFGDVKEIYRTKQNVLERLRRDRELQDLLRNYA